MTKKKPRHWHGPSWWDKDQWGCEQSEHREHREHRRPPPTWWNSHRRRGGPWLHSDQGLFFRFALVFGFFVLLGCGILAVLAVGALFFFREGLPAPTRPWPVIWPVLGLVLVLLIALRWVGSLASRRFTVPLSETMKAADALASGDLSARVPEQGDGELRRFVRSFNVMAEALEAADRQRRELLADVAHELRTPLTIIQGNLEGLRDGVYDPSPDHLDLVLDETRNLSRLVEDLRLLAVAEAGQLRMKPQMLDVRQLLVDVRDAFTAQADEAGISLAVEVSSPVPPLYADPQRLGQVLGNLLANSLQHTPSGGLVTLGAEADSEWREVQLWVADTGEGIPGEDLPYLFDRFYRTDKSRTRSTGGAGLGLPIARQLVRAHGGRIGVESQLGQGTRFTVALPVAGD